MGDSFASLQRGTDAVAATLLVLDSLLRSLPFIAPAVELGGVDAHAWLGVVEAAGLRIKAIDCGRHATALPCAQRVWRLHGKKDR